jgi:hypothetical protein
MYVCIFYDLLSMVTFYNEKNDVIVSEYIEHVKGQLSTLFSKIFDNDHVILNELLE